MGKTTPAVRRYLAGIGRRGAEARASRYSHRQLSEWSRKGGKPPALAPEGIRKLLRLERRGLTQEQIADELRVSASTIRRALARHRKGD